MAFNRQIETTPAMPTRRGSYGQQGTRSGVRRGTRRRGSVSSRIRYQRPSARNQKRQLRSVAKIALANRRMLNANKVYTDWFLNQQVVQADGLWRSFELTSPTAFQAGNREDADFIVSQNAFFRNMIFEWYCSSQDKISTVSFDMYIVSLRSSAANWQPGTYPSGVWQDGNEYTSAGNNNSAFVNSGIFKIHWAKQLHISPKKYSTDPSVDDQTGNPFATYRNGKVNLKLNFKVRSPAGLTWKNLPMSALPPNQRMYFIFRAASVDTTNPYLLNWAAHMTAVGLS